MDFHGRTESSLTFLTFSESLKQKANGTVHSSYFIPFFRNLLSKGDVLYFLRKNIPKMYREAHLNISVVLMYHAKIDNLQ